MTFTNPTPEWIADFMDNLRDALIRHSREGHTIVIGKDQEYESKYDEDGRLAGALYLGATVTIKYGKPAESTQEASPR